MIDKTDYEVSEQLCIPYINGPGPTIVSYRLRSKTTRNAYDVIVVFSEKYIGDLMEVSVSFVDRKPLYSNEPPLPAEEHTVYADTDLEVRQGDRRFSFMLKIANAFCIFKDSRAQSA